MDTYKIIRFYKDPERRNKVLFVDRTLEWAEKWCAKDTSRKVNAKGETVWFDGFTKE